MGDDDVTYWGKDLKWVTIVGFEGFERGDDVTENLREKGFERGDH